MSRPATAVVPVPRPGILDFFLLLAGCALSFSLARMPLLREPAPNGLPLAAALVPALPSLLRLPEGVLLLGPLFYLSQRVRGRYQPLTAAEWLWSFAWLGTAGMTALAALLHGSVLSEAARPYIAFWPPLLWYLVLVPSLALVAAVLVPFGLFRREPPPWTHSLGLALLLWPILPLACLLAFGKFT
jgi:hypothetical protein